MPRDALNLLCVAGVRLVSAKLVLALVGLPLFIPLPLLSAPEPAATQGSQPADYRNVRIDDLDTARLFAALGSIE